MTTQTPSYGMPAAPLTPPVEPSPLPPPSQPAPYGRAEPSKPPTRAWRPIGEVLVDAGAITREDLEWALEQQQRTGMRLGEVLIEAGRISWLALAQAIGDQSGAPAPVVATPAAPPPVSVAEVVETNDPVSKLEAVEALLRERQRAFIELVSTTERLRRRVSELEDRLTERNAELASLKQASFRDL